MPELMQIWSKWKVRCERLTTQGFQQTRTDAQVEEEQSHPEVPENTRRIIGLRSSTRQIGHELKELKYK